MTLTSPPETCSATEATSGFLEVWRRRERLPADASCSPALGAASLAARFCSARAALRKAASPSPPFRLGAGTPWSLDEDGPLPWRTWAARREPFCCAASAASAEAGRRRRRRDGAAACSESSCLATPERAAFGFAEPLPPNFAASSSRIRRRRGVGPLAAIRSARSRPSPTSSRPCRHRARAAPMRYRATRCARAHRASRSRDGTSNPVRSPSLAALRACHVREVHAKDLAVLQTQDKLLAGAFGTRTSALPSGVSISAFFFGARDLKSLYASNS